MAPNTVQNFENLHFNLFNSKNFLGVRDSSDPDVKFLNSVPKEQTQCFIIDNITVELNSSKKIISYHFTLKYKWSEQKL